MTDSGNGLNWDGLLARVRTDYPQVYRSWFAQLPPADLQGGELRIRVDSVAKARYLAESCTEAFVRSAMALSGLLVGVRFLSEATDAQHATSGACGLKSLPLNPDYTFDEFVVGPSNRLAHAACRAVCNQPGQLYNPLFVHGASGLGKTHLLQATCAAMQQLPHGPNVLFLSCETFVNEFVQAIECGHLPEFRDCARHASFLVIDDVQFLANRESSQEELFHTFNTLYQSRHQIILSADSPPSDIPTLEERIVSRFHWGLVAQIDPPDRETRQAILQKKARLRGAEIPPAVLDYLAEHVEANIRVLEGTLTKLISEVQLSGKPLTIETARLVLEALDIRKRRPIQISDILDAVATHFGLRPAELVGRRRSRSVSYPRQLCVYLARKLTSMSLEDIGVHLGGRDHSTVLHAERSIENSLKHEPETADAIAHLMRTLSSRR